MDKEHLLVMMDFVDSFMVKRALIDFLLLHLSDMGQGIQKLSTIINSEI